MYIKDDVEGCFIEKRGSNGLVVSEQNLSFFFFFFCVCSDLVLSEQNLCRRFGAIRFQCVVDGILLIIY